MLVLHTGYFIFTYWNAVSFHYILASQDKCSSNWIMHHPMPPKNAFNDSSTFIFHQKKQNTVKGSFSDKIAPKAYKYFAYGALDIFTRLIFQARLSRCLAILQKINSILYCTPTELKQQQKGFCCFSSVAMRPFNTSYKSPFRFGQHSVYYTRINR